MRPSPKKSVQQKSDVLSFQKKELLDLFNSPEVQSWRALMDAFRFIFVQLEKGLMADNCSMSRFQILIILYTEGQLAAVEIARKLVVTRGNISTFLRRMESDGLVATTIPNGQKRPVYFLTKKGILLFEKIFPQHIERVHHYAPKLSPSVRDQLQEVCRK